MIPNLLGNVLNNYKLLKNSDRIIKNLVSKAVFQFYVASGLQISSVAVFFAIWSIVLICPIL